MLNIYFDNNTLKISILILYSNFIFGVFYTIIKLKYSFFGKNNENNRDKIIMREDLDTITNTYSNNGNI